MLLSVFDFWSFFEMQVPTDKVSIHFKREIIGKCLTAHISDTQSKPKETQPFCRFKLDLDPFAMFLQNWSLVLYLSAPVDNKTKQA